MLTEAAFRDLIGAIYDAGLDAALWPEALRRMSDPFDVVGAGVMVGDPAQRIGVFATRNMDPAFQRSYDAYYNRLDPVIPRAMALLVGAVVRAASVNSATERTEFYQDWLRPQGLHDGLVCNFVRAGRQFGVLALSRGTAAGAFGKQQIGLVGRIVPHLQRAVRMQRALGAGAAAPPVSLTRCTRCRSRFC